MARHRANADLAHSAHWTPDITGACSAKHAAAGGTLRRNAIRGVLSAAVVTGAALVTLPAQASAHTLAATPSASFSPQVLAAAVAQTPAKTTASATSAGARAAAIALAQVGKPYVWGATGPSSFDCSGLTQWSYRQVGVSLPRTTVPQSQTGTAVSPSQLQPGDLVFFYSSASHVGIYVGNGMVVHAPQPGQNVKVTAMKYMPFHNARRVA